MIRKTTLAFALCLGALGVQVESHATLIDQGNTTLQSSNGLEWLDLTATQGFSINAILSGAGGFVADGWTFANFSQVTSLFAEAGAAPRTDGWFSSDPATIAAAQSLNQLFGTLSPDISFYPDPMLFPGSTGFALSDDGSYASQFVYQVAADSSSARLWDTSVFFQWDPSVWNGINSSIGNYLVRQTSVPEPSVALMFLLGLACAMGLRRQVR